MKVAKVQKELFLTVSQKEKKHATSSFDFAAVKLILVQKDSRGRLTYIGAKNNSGRQVFQVFENLQPGTYQVYVEVDTLQEVVLSCYSQDKVDFSGEQPVDRMDFLQQTMTSYLYTNAEKKTYSSEGIPEAYKLVCKFEFGFVGFLYRNDSLEATL